MESFWSRLSWPQVVAFAVLVLGVVAILVFVPSEKLQAVPWEGIAGVVAVIVGGGASTFLGPLVRPRSSPTSIPPAARSRPTEPPPSSRAGFVDVDLAGWILVWALAALVALSSTGCGAGGIPAFVLAAKPAVDTACHVARASCDFVATACDVVSPTAGGDAAREVDEP